MDLTNLNLNDELLNNSDVKNSNVIINFPDVIKINRYKTFHDYFCDFMFFVCCVLFVVFLPLSLLLLVAFFV
jgi:hypothetical protein